MHRNELEWIDSQQNEMERLTREWSNVCSGSDYADGLQRMLTLLRDAFGSLGGACSEHSLPERTVINSKGEEVPVPVGKALRFVKRPEAPIRVLFSGHMDTVFGQQHPFQEVRELERGVWNGPGVSDLKGGLVVMLTALRAFERSDLADKIGWEVVLNPDEEVGSKSSEELLRESARRCHVGLVFEPSLPDGAFISERKGSGNYAAIVRGRPAHVGREYEKGRNAIICLAKFIERVDSLRRDGVVVNVGEIEGGGPVNVVPDLAIARFNIRVDNRQLLEEVTAELDKIEADLNSQDGITLQLWRSHFREPKPFTEATKKLFADIKKCCEELGLPCRWQASGGVCDGNIIASEGVPTIDTLGVRGGKIHTDEEYILLESLAERAKLATLYLLQLASTN